MNTAVKATFTSRHVSKFIGLDVQWNEASGISVTDTENLFSYYFGQLGYNPSVIVEGTTIHLDLNVS